MSLPSRRIALAVVGAAVALLAAWIVPALAIVVAWPLLLVVPGWAIVAALSPRIDAAGRIGLAVVGSVVISTHLVYWLSVAAGGYGRGTVFAALAVLALLSAVLFGRTPAARLRVPRSTWPALAVAGVAMAIVGGTLGSGLWRVTDTGVTSGGSNWSDLGVHLSIAQSLNAGGNFPPEVPYFAGEPLVYHWFADFGAAILAKAAGLFSVPAMVVQSSVLAGALALLVFSLARRLLRDRRARRAATIAAILGVLGGGLGWIRLIGDMTVDPLAANAPAAAGDLVELVKQHSYDNQWLTEWPYFSIPSVLSTGLLAHRATAAGLPILVAVLLLLVAGLPTARQRALGWRDRPVLVAGAGVLGALLAPFHFFFFPLVPLLALAWVIAGGRLVDRDAPRNALAFILPYLAAVPFAVGAALQAGGSGALRLSVVWPSARPEDGIAAVVFFFLTNLGVPFVLALVALAVPGLPRRGFLAAWIIGLFLVPNLVQASVIDFDMNKVFQAMWIGVAIAAAWLVRRWPWPAVGLVLLVSLPSPLLVAVWTATSDYQVLSRSQLDAAEWIAENTPPDAVFVTDGWLNAPTDAAGRKRLTTFPPYVANLGFQPDERVSNVTTIYCGGSADLSAELARRYGATFLIEGMPSPCPAPVDFSSSDAFELVYDAGPRIWRILGPDPAGRLDTGSVSWFGCRTPPGPSWPSTTS